MAKKRASKAAPKRTSQPQKRVGKSRADVGHSASGLSLNALISAGACLLGLALFFWLSKDGGSSDVKEADSVTEIDRIVGENPDAEVFQMHKQSRAAATEVVDKQKKIRDVMPEDEGNFNSPFDEKKN